MEILKTTEEKTRVKNCYVLYNSLAGNSRGAEMAHALDNILKDETPLYYDMTKISDYSEFFGQISDERIIVVGGDGTLNRFVNDTSGIEIKSDVYLFAAGSGNDFLNDIEKNTPNAIVRITEYIKDLPTATVKGKTMKFINGIGFGVDGYCCQVAEELRKKSDKRTNYTAIAIKGLLGKYHRTNAKVTIDGVTVEYSDVWMVSTMNGRYYGGGMMVTPGQDRLDPDGCVSVAVLHCKSNLETLLKFPAIFKGTHIRFKDIFEVTQGHEIKIEFDRPAPVQIDGDAILDVTECSISARKPSEK